MIKLDFVVKVSDEDIKDFLEEAYEAIQPNGKFSIQSRENDYPTIKLEIDDNYPILVESFFEKYFGKKGLEKLYLLTRA